MNTCPNSAELRAAMVNSKNWPPEWHSEAMLAAGGTILPCLPVRISWWRRIWRWLADWAAR